MGLDKKFEDLFIGVSCRAALSAATLSFFPTKKDDDIAALDVTLINLSKYSLSIVMKF